MMLDILFELAKTHALPQLRSQPYQANGFQNVIWMSSDGHLSSIFLESLGSRIYSKCLERKLPPSTLSLYPMLLLVRLVSRIRIVFFIKVTLIWTHPTDSSPSGWLKGNSGIVRVCISGISSNFPSWCLRKHGTPSPF